MVALFFIGDRVGGYFLKNMVKTSQFRYSKLYRGEAKADILFLGNSRGLGFYIPQVEKITGKKAFNLSYNGLPINIGRALLQDYVEKNGAPEIFVLDVSMINRMDTTLVSGFNVYSPYSRQVGEVVKTYSKNVFYAGKLSHLFLHNSEIFQRALFYRNQSDSNWIVDRQINENMANSVDDQRPFYVGPFDSTVVNILYEELKNTVDIALENNMKVKLVVSPFYPPFVKKIVNMPEFITRVEKTTGLKVYNFADALEDKEGFGDYQHVNYRGAITYMDILNSNGIFD